ncbi:hypothetical protein F4823DRAFT_609935 [Ustulina deusta]|nr:hypothetical protein F4823DRAFT_609935 [Ustulina deusta]
MLRGRLGKRDISICALCQCRLSLPPRPPPSASRFFAAATRCASNYDPDRVRPYRLLPSAAGGSVDTSTSPRAQSLSTTTSPTPQHPHSASRALHPVRIPIKDAKTPPPVQRPAPVFAFRTTKTALGDRLNPHEMKARQKLIAEHNAQHGPGSYDPLAKSRLVLNSPRQQAIERYLKEESSKMYGDTSRLNRRPLTTPGISLPGRDVGSTLSIRSEPDTKSSADRVSSVGDNFYRRVAYHPDPPLRKIPVRTVPQTENPSALTRQQPAIGRNSDSNGFVASSLSSLAGSGAFGLASVGNVLATRRSQTAEFRRVNTESPFPGFGKSAADSASQRLGTVGALSSGFGALEAAGAHDMEMKASTQRGSRGIGISQEWGQLARKPISKANLGNDFWSAGQSSVAESQPASDPQAIKNDTVADNQSVEGGNNSISQAPPRHGDNDLEKNSRWDISEQEKKPDKRRGGKRSQQSSWPDDDDGADDYDRHEEKRRQKELRKAEREAERTEPIPIVLPELISITAFANALKIRPEDFLVQLGELGFEGVTLDSLMAGETAALVAQEYGYDPTVDVGDTQDLKPRPPPEDPSVLPSRPPVVTIMGHVDHGKTTILDYLRKSSVAAQEHGGITQHIGAFSVTLSSGKPITFLDTPGHAAFLTMRQRGAYVTDIVVLVVAADDSVKPQTLEAVKHARAAKVPIIVAINKIDKDGARIDAVKHDLAKADVEIEDFGGDVQVVCVSGKTGQGMDDLEENILALSEILDHRAEPDGAAEGWVLESSLKPTGKVATVLVKRGTLRPGDYIAAGVTWAKIRQLRNEAGVSIAEAPPGTPVEILGWRDLPAAGDQVIQSPNEDKAKTAVSYREGLREREKDAAEYEVISEARKTLQEKRAGGKTTTEGGTGVQEVLPDEENGTKMVNFVVKGDVHGSMEAVCAAIQELGSHEVRPRVLRSATGPISKSDVDHAATSKSVLVNFAMAIPGHVRQMAKEHGVRILDHNVIYHLIDDVKANLSECLAPGVSIRVVGEAEVLQIFPINLRGRVYKNIAGCRVRNGVVGKNNLYRVMRNGEAVFHGKLETLKQVKKDVMEMRKGSECGMGFEEFQDLEVGDQVQAYEEIHTTRSL